MFKRQVTGQHGTLSQAIEQAHSKRQAEFWAGRYAASLALEQLGAIHQPLLLNRQPDGRADFPRFTIGSISHSQALAVALAAWYPQIQRIGIDLQQLMPLSRAERLMTRIMQPQEFRLGARLNHDPAQWLTWIFSAKEALFKMLYPDVLKIMPFNAASVIAYHAGIITMQLQCNWGKWPVATEFRLHLVALNQAVMVYGLIDSPILSVGNNRLS